MKRTAIIILCAVLLLGLLPLKISHPVHAATASQNNIVARADYMYNILWTCQQDVYGWNYGTLFTAGNRYHVPYGQPINSGAYIGYYVSIDDFITAANTAGSVFYTSRSTYNSTSSVYYATDCSAFVSWCWGVDRKTTYSIPQVSTYIGMATASNTSLLQLGDCLNSNDVGHVVLVTDLTYDSSGNLTQIEITEQTPPQLKRSYWTPSDLGAYYGGYYGIYRYTGTVPAAPDGSTNSGSADTSGKYYPACSASATTFYDGMSEIGITCDWDLHCRIAEKNGITNFSGTAEQNEQLLTLLKAGTLLNPDHSGTDDPSSSSGTVTSGSNGYERGYAGGMAGTGEYKAFGLDVSSWQGSSLNFTRIKNAGYDYVILRAGTTNGKDECFETYYTNAKAAGLDVGAYYYSYATSVSAVQSDMNYFLSYISGKTFEYPIYFDYEDASQQALSASLSQQICLTAMDMLAAEGYLVGMYTGKYFSTQLPMSTICAKYEVWIAHYLAVGDGSYDGTYDYTTYGPTYSTQYGMYQFTDSVWINGYGPYDGDVCYKDYPAIVKQYGFNGYAAEGSDDSYMSQCTYYPSHASLKVTEATTVKSEPRSASDDLEDAPLDATYTATGLYANSAGNMWYQVKTAEGSTGYLYSQRLEYLGIDTSDITVTNYTLPVDHAVGDVFVVNGTISSTYNKLNMVAVYIYSGKTTAGTPVTGGDATVSNNKYTLENSDIDNATSFGDLTTGIYTYAISANYTSYYASAKREATAVSQNILLLDHAFSVGGAVLEETYFDKCTFYPSRALFTTNRDTSIFSEPRTQKTGNTSVALEDAPNGTQYTSTGLYVNSGGNIFYQVTTSDGQDGYIYSGYTTFDKKAYDDIKISGATYPNGHVQGNTFDVTGTVKSTYNVLGTLKVQVFSGVDTSVDPVTGGSATVSNNQYALSGSAIDLATAFDELPLGLHTYLITVTFSSYYAKSATELGTLNGTRTVKQHYFTVISSAADQSSCSHSNTTAVVKEATCTDTGTTVTSCSICGLTEKTTTEKLDHSYGSYVVTKEATCVETGSKEKTCTVCGKVYTKEIAVTDHTYSANTCTEAATCTVCGVSTGEPLGHSYTSTVTAPTCQADGYTTYTCSTCGDSYKDDHISATGHSWKDATCTDPMICTICGATSGSAAGHTWTNATCTEPQTCRVCGSTSGSALGHSYEHEVTAPGCLTDGYTTHTCTACGDSYKDSYVTASGHSWNGASCTTPMTCQVCGISSGTALGHSYKVTITAPGCLTDGYTTHTCTTCGHTYNDEYVTASGHSWKAATCTAPMTCSTCGTTNGSPLGHSYKHETIAAGCLTDGYTIHTCTTCGNTYKDSFVIASGHDWIDATCTSPMICSTCNTTVGSSIGHSYSSGICTICGAADPDFSAVVQPSLSLNYGTVSFESEILYNIYFNASNLDSVVEMGMITFDSQLTDGTIDDAVKVYSDYSTDGSVYMVATEGIAAKNMADQMWFKIYAKLSDGSYVYTTVNYYSAVRYATSILNRTSSSSYSKALVVGMLNYGAEAQLYFGHNTDNLANAGLTEEQKALNLAYDETMVDAVVAPATSKTANFVYTASAFTNRYPSVSFDGAFSINFYFVASQAPDDGMTFYYWDIETYDSVDVLTKDNATGTMDMTLAGTNSYYGVVDGIAAKEMDETVFVAGVYEVDGVEYNTGIIAYSLGKYCETIAAKDTSDQQAFAQATAVYGYYAKEYFKNL